jgi:hypothetical protein
VQACLAWFFGEKSFCACGLAVHPQFTCKSPAVHCCFFSAGPKWAQLDGDGITEAVEPEERKRRKSMKSQILTVAAAVVFTALAPAVSHAQEVTEAKVPFAFQAGEAKMPAGEYQIRRTLSSSKAVQQIRRTDSSASTFVMTYPTDAREKNAVPKLIFNC